MCVQHKAFLCTQERRMGLTFVFQIKYALFFIFLFLVLHDSTSSCCCPALRLVRDPLVRDGHEVSFHGQAEALAVLGGLDDGGLRLSRNHAHGLAHALHFLDYVVLQSGAKYRENTLYKITWERVWQRS